MISAISWDYTIHINRENEEKLRNASTHKKLFDNNWKIKFYNYEKDHYKSIDPKALKLISMIPYNPSFQNVASLKLFLFDKIASYFVYVFVQIQAILSKKCMDVEIIFLIEKLGYRAKTCAVMEKLSTAFHFKALGGENIPPFASSYINDSMAKITPFYQLIHGYARYKLKNYYHLNDENFINGLIPTQLTENAWGQNWESISSKIFPITSNPFKEIINNVLKTQNLSLKNLVNLSEKYFKSLAFPKLSQEFWDNSIIIKPSNNNLTTCYPSAWNMFKGDDFRIMFCQKTNYASWMNLYHELGHIYYYMAYQNLSILYRMSPNLAFHESIGDTIALSALSPWGLNFYGWDITVNPEQEMEFLFSQALRKIPLFMFAYSLEDWRYNTLIGNIKPENYNSKWWEIVGKYQGLSPPIKRNENNFDPAFKFHIIKNQNFLEYLQATVLQFQLFKVLCEKANGENANIPLHRCNLHGSKVAGKVLWNLMRLGNQISWRQMLLALTGKPDYDIQPLLEYFRPLIQFIKEEVIKNNIKIGWII
ncbi:angiotensin-converting enzyme-like [Gordionus sp. m RMFG-2023]|uniref:angiotensin-converting enzyme-like n=1 Tax=Gordionus sp. m RMFG-2023 TaxID=3053472 RepID=UPI0031FDEA65